MGLLGPATVPAIELGPEPTVTPFEENGRGAQLEPVQASKVA
jgi:hypothetical protein